MVGRAFRTLVVLLFLATCVAFATLALTPIFKTATEAALGSR